MKGSIAITCSSVGRAEDQQSGDSDFEPRRGWVLFFKFFVFWQKPRVTIGIFGSKSRHFFLLTAK